MRIAAFQMDVKIGQVEENMSAVTDRMRSAGEQGIDLAVFPECALTGYCFESRDEAMGFARELDSPEIQTLVDAARTHRLHAAIGLLERSGDQLFNAQILVGPDGLLGSYRKIHLPHLGVDRFVDPGDRPPSVVQAGEARIGLAICYDSTFPEMSRVLSLDGADIIALSTNWPAAAQRVARTIPPCRSFENQVYFVAANRIGSERGFQFCGLSSIHGPPDGTCLAQAQGDEETLLIADVSLGKVRSKRIERVPGKHVVDLFGDRRPQFYGRIVE